MGSTKAMDMLSGGWGGFNQSLALTSLSPDKLTKEMMTFAM
jgi:hypothetical protein